MRLSRNMPFSNPFDIVFVSGLVYLSAMVACAGIDLEFGLIRIHSAKVIVPGMATWLAGFLAGFWRWRQTAASGDEAAEVSDRPAPGGTGALLGALAAAALLVSLALARAVPRPLFTDDLIMVQSASVMDGTMLGAMFRGSSWSTPGFIRPVPELAWWLEYRLHGCRPLLCHLVNLGLHLVNVLLVGLLARRLLGDPRRAVAAMLLFAVCGTHAEPLLWLASRYDLMAATFALAALVLWLRWLDGAPALAAALACALLALLSKEAALPLPLMMALLAVARDAPLSSRLRGAAPPLGLLAAYMGYRLVVLGGLTPGHGGSWVGLDKLAQLPLSALAPLGWPFNLEQLADLAAPARLVIGVTLACAPLLVAWRVARGPDRPTLLAYALLVLATAPVHNVISLSASLRQSRYVYMPAAFYALLLGAATRGLRWRRAALVLAALVTCHAALLRSNAEPFAAAGVTVERALAQAGPVVEALRSGAVVELRGLPQAYRGTHVCAGNTLLMPLTQAAGVSRERLWIERDTGRPAPARIDRVFVWSPDAGFREAAGSP